MRKLFLIFALSLPAFGQFSNFPNTITVKSFGAPTVACSYLMLAADVTNSDMYFCPGGTWIKANSAVASVFGRTGAVVATSGDYSVGLVTGAAPLASPTFTGIPAAPTATSGTNTTQLATAAFVRANSQSAYLNSLYTNATTTFSSVTGLSFAVAASTNYKIRCDLDYQTSATTADVKIQWTGPASPTFLVYDLVSQVTASTLSNSVNPATATTTGAFSTALSEAGTPTITTNFPLTLTMTLINGANAGTVQLQAAATGTGTISILPGSCVLNQ